MAGQRLLEGLSSGVNKDFRTKLDQIFQKFFFNNYLKLLNKDVKM